VKSRDGLKTVPYIRCRATRRRGFFLVYINSFNEWHEGHQFEPMRDWGDLTRAERASGYHNPDDGDYRLKALGKLLRDVIRT
jgi:hypothetical protein